jgi:hypothetical protein
MQRPAHGSAIALACIASCLFCSAGAAADPRGPTWVERPIILAPLRASFDAGIAVARVERPDGMRTPAGTSFEVAFGLPFLTELGVRVGRRFGEAGRLAAVDRHARLYDHETANTGADDWANPEIRLRISMVDFGDVALAVEGRMTLPVAEPTRLTIAPGIPIRIRIAHRARIDTGLFMPFRYDPDTRYTISWPVELWFRAGIAFFGPLTGVRFHRVSVAGGDATNRVDIAAGLGLGCTLGPVDLKTQMYSLRINDAEGRRSYALSFGMGLTL